jgi:hypothetical protein
MDKAIRVLKFLYASLGAYLDYKFPGRVQRVAKRKLNKAIKK